jgi:predicted TIM-barrel fold metal-dependent hydrolase
MEIREQAFAGRPIDVPVIDAHTHILGYGHNGWYQSFNSTKDVVAMMDHVGIDAIVTAPHSLVIGDIDLTNEEAAKAAREFPGRIYGYICVRPQQGLEAVRATIEKYSKNPAFVGFKFLAGYHGPLGVLEYDYALDFAAEAECPVLSHLWGNDPTLADVERAAKQRPGLKLMMAHQGGGSRETTDAYVKLMKQYPNLYMEICGSLYNQYSMEEIVEKAGEDRVIFGTDLINLDPRFDLGRVIFSTLSDAVKKKVLAENYLKLLEGSKLGKIVLKRKS